MKKLFMGLMAVTMLSTAAFAGTDANASTENADAKAVTEKPAENKSEVEVSESFEENNGMFRKKCVYTLTVYNGNGQVIDTFTSSTYVENSCSGFFGTAAMMYRHMLADGSLGI
ncbi:hypothetical protein [Sphingobacterium chungjuense]|uniref:hypothetical protein n=1 Tax=Sphingobacterium chungjuense TaxID=2675553 RepID=UPI00140999FD|nr:hypothetical protein [Sphingobacterium chungjuense]